MDARHMTILAIIQHANIWAVFLLPVLSALATQVVKIIALYAKYDVKAVAAQVVATAFAYLIAHYPPIAPYVSLFQTAEGANITVALSAVLAPIGHNALNALNGLLAWLESLGAVPMARKAAAKAALAKQGG